MEQDKNGIKINIENLKSNDIKHKEIYDYSILEIQYDMDILKLLNKLKNEIFASNTKRQIPINYATI